MERKLFPLLEFLQGEHVADSPGRRGDERSDELGNAVALSGCEFGRTSGTIRVGGALR